MTIQQMFKKRFNPNKDQHSTTATRTPLDTNNITAIDQISFLVSPNDIPVLYHTMKSVVTKLEPYMEQSGVLKDETNKGLVPNISSVLVETTGLKSTLLNFDSDSCGYSYAAADTAAATATALVDLKIDVTWKARKDKKSDDGVNDIDLNQQMPFQNTNEPPESIKKVVTLDKYTEKVDLQNDGIKSIESKECESIMDPICPPVSNTALTNLLYEYNFKAHEYDANDLNQNNTSSSSASTVACDDENTFTNQDNKHHQVVDTAPLVSPQRDDYLATILEEYSPFYNCPIDEETSEVERSCYNPYKIVFSGQF